MKLSDYLEKRAIKKTQFAKQIGITVQSLYYILDGADTNVSIALKIEEITNGEVRCEDLVPEAIRIKRQLLLKQKR